MFDANDRIVFCRCFDATSHVSEHVRRGPEDAPHPPAHAGRAPAAPCLRPDVHCLQRWIDLNA